MSGISELLALGALQKLNEERALNISNEANLRNELKDQKNKEAVQRINSDFTEEQLEEARNMMKSLRLSGMTKENQIIKLENQVHFYETLLEDNLETIAANSESFKKTLNKERDRLSTWMISQKGFMDVANEFGLKLGYSNSDVQKLATERGLAIAIKESDLDLHKSEYSPFNADRINRIKKDIKR